MGTQSYTGVDNLDIMSLAKNYNNYLLRLIAQYAPRHGAILDFGAGSGTYAHDVPREGRTILCVEPDATLRNILVQKDLNPLETIDDVASDSVDFAYSFNVLEHIENDLQALKDLIRVMKSGGRCLIYVPAMPILYSAMDKKVCHFRRYTRSELVEKSRTAGFDIEISRYADCIGVLATLIYKAVGDSNGDISADNLVAYDRFAFPLSRALDNITHPFMGKNVIAVIRKP
ncbi:MAG: class I SAM-dependent methyltransferase [Thalassospira sp.]|uniref:class I SAM-dependent methyltransferase n=1 Tax=Thalassospira sp. TaxID=1912094 RepID=UPI0032F0151E